jgi:hypothetical protein
MRVEYKYLVPNESLSRLRGMIAPFVETDVHAVAYGERGYTVRSIYFDTCALDFYHQKLAGVKVRKKLRLRGYNGGHTSIMKNRAPLEYAHLQNLFATGNVERYVLASQDFPRALEDARRFFFHFCRNALRPIALVVYEREAYHSKFDPSLRITFDKCLRSAIHPALDALFKEEEIRYLMPRHFILEVKHSGRFPSWLRSAVGTLGLRRQALSKYVIGIDRHGTLRGNAKRPALAFARPCHF